MVLQTCLRNVLVSPDEAVRPARATRIALLDQPVEVHAPEILSEFQ
jgi:hypothetical protein